MSSGAEARFHTLLKLPHDLIPTAMQATRLFGRFLQVGNDANPYDWDGLCRAVNDRGGRGVRIVNIDNPPNTKPMIPFFAQSGGPGFANVGSQNVLVLQNNGIFQISTFGFNPALDQLAHLNQVAGIAQIGSFGPMVGLSAAAGAANAANAGLVAANAAATIGAALGVINGLAIANILSGILQEGVPSLEVVAMVDWIIIALSEVLKTDIDRKQLTTHVQTTFTNLKWAHDSGFANFWTSDRGTNSSWDYSVVFASPTDDPNVFTTIVAIIRVSADIEDKTSWWGLEHSRAENFSSSITAVKLSVDKSFTA